MADRADYLARTLITRLANLHERFTEDGRGEPNRAERIEVIEKVLAVELGVTDSRTLALVDAAMPVRSKVEHGSSRELSEFARFLRQHLREQLTQS